MKKMFLRGAIAVLGLGMVATLGSCSSSEGSTDVLYVGMECNYQPFNWTTSTETENTLPIYHDSNFADGYDVAVSKYLGQKLNKEVIVKKIEWSSLIPSLNSDEIDIVLAGMTDTEERRQSIDFSNPYLASDLAFLVRTKDVPSNLGTKENPATYEQLLNLFDGKSLVCQSGVVGDDFIDTYFVNNSANKEIRHSEALPTYPLAANDVNGGISFAMPAELPVIEAMVNINPNNLRVLYCDYSFLSADDQNGLTVSIGIKKGNDELKNSINAALEELSVEERGRMIGSAAERSANN